MAITFSNRFGRGGITRLAKTITSFKKIISTSNGSSTTDGDYTVVTYTGSTSTTLTLDSGTGIPPTGKFPGSGRESTIISNVSPASFDVLVVGGGMSGQGGHEQGGHGGGAVEATVTLASTTPYPLTVGGGSATPAHSNSAQSSGNPSSGFSQTIPGATQPSTTNANYYGYSRGECKRGTAGWPGSPFSGRNTYHPTEGPVAGNPVPGPNPNWGRRGGNGLYSEITGTGVYYGGGGGGAGGGGYETSQGGKGGFGGGGGGGTGPGGPGGQPGTPSGTYGSPPGPGGATGATNSGGGGGSGGIGFCGATYCSGKSGGSGIIIIRYLT